MQAESRQRFAIIGAGMSGICMGVKLQERGIDDFLIIEKSPDVGGTWYDNSYPGACCDVASVLYSYSFEPNPDWSRVFSPHKKNWRIKWSRLYARKPILNLASFAANR